MREVEKYSKLRLKCSALFSLTHVDDDGHVMVTPSHSLQRQFREAVHCLKAPNTLFKLSVCLATEK